MKEKNIDVLKILIEKSGERINIRQLSEELKMNYKNVYNIVKRLENAGLLSLERFGKAIGCTLNEKVHPLIFQAEYERREMLLKNKSFKVLYNRLKVINGQFILILFGSYVKKTAAKRSDIDLLLITDNPKEVQNEIELLPLNIHLTHVNYKDFMTMLKSKEQTVVSEAVKKNIILFGIEDYYRLIENAK